MPETDREQSGRPDRTHRDPVAGVDENRDVIVVRLTGELDLYNAEEVRAALLEACSRQAGRVVVDLSEVEFMDSTTLGVLVEAKRKAPNGFALAAPGLEPRRVLETTGLDRHFAVHDSLQDALDSSV